MLSLHFFECNGSSCFRILCTALQLHHRSLLLWLQGWKVYKGKMLARSDEFHGVNAATYWRRFAANYRCHGNPFYRPTPSLTIGKKSFIESATNKQSIRVQ